MKLNDLQHEVSAEIRSSVAKRKQEIELEERNAEMREHILNMSGDPVWRGATKFKVPGCECVAEKLGRDWTVDACPKHSEEV